MHNRSVTCPSLVSVVIVNYNGRKFLDELLTTLDAQTFRDYETLFIDNASQDGSVSHVAANYGWVRVLPQSSNLGFARACNLGARESQSEYVAFLNADLRLDAHWLAELVSVADHNNVVAAVASKLLLYADRERLNGVGGGMNYLGYTWDRGMLEIDRGQYDCSDAVLFASAGAALFRRHTYLDAGGFDEKFFMYHEDVDLCWRLWLLGFRVVTAPKAVAYHHFGGSTREARSADWRELIGERNNIRALIKNYEAPSAARALRDMALLPLLPRRRTQQWLNFLWNIIQLPDTLVRRRAIQRARVRSDAEIVHLIRQDRNVAIKTR
jgi:GT2 family glycosyltransferase